LVKTEADILKMDKLTSQKINDATGRLTQSCLMPTETKPGHMQVLHNHILAHSVPVALYGDKHNIFRTNTKDADPELGLQGAKVTVHEHFDVSRELLWKRRKLIYSVTGKPQWQSPVMNGKLVNVQIDIAMAKRNTGHKSIPDYSWRRMPIGKLARDG
jgi:hypothetical protein